MEMCLVAASKNENVAESKMSSADSEKVKKQEKEKKKTQKKTPRNKKKTTQKKTTATTRLTSSSSTPKTTTKKTKKKRTNGGKGVSSAATKKEEKLSSTAAAAATKKEEKLSSTAAAAATKMEKKLSSTAAAAATTEDKAGLNPLVTKKRTVKTEVRKAQKVKKTDKESSGSSGMPKLSTRETRPRREPTVAAAAAATTTPAKRRRVSNQEDSRNFTQHQQQLTEAKMLNKKKQKIENVSTPKSSGLLQSALAKLSSASKSSSSESKGSSTTAFITAAVGAAVAPDPRSTIKPAKTLWGGLSWKHIFGIKLKEDNAIKIKELRAKTRNPYRIRQLNRKNDHRNKVRAGKKNKRSKPKIDTENGFCEILEQDLGCQQSVTDIMPRAPPFPFTTVKVPGSDSKASRVRSFVDKNLIRKMGFDYVSTPAWWGLDAVPDDGVPFPDVVYPNDDPISEIPDNAGLRPQQQQLLQKRRDTFDRSSERPKRDERLEGGGGGSNRRATTTTTTTATTTMRRVPPRIPRHSVDEMSDVYGQQVVDMVLRVIYGAIDDSYGRIREDDFDFLVVDQLCRLPRQDVEYILQDFDRSLSPAIRNRSAWLMGCVKNAGRRPGNFRSRDSSRPQIRSDSVATRVWGENRSRWGTTTEAPRFQTSEREKKGGGGGGGRGWGEQRFARSGWMGSESRMESSEGRRTYERGGTSSRRDTPDRKRHFDQGRNYGGNEGDRRPLPQQRSGGDYGRSGGDYGHAQKRGR
eukprot:g5511.t1